MIERRDRPESFTTADVRDLQLLFNLAWTDPSFLASEPLAGLVTNYLPDRGNFDAWAADPDNGERLNLADLDLVQKRNHILNAALTSLDDKSRQLLSTLALLSEPVDYLTLSSLNLFSADLPFKVASYQL